MKRNKKKYYKFDGIFCLFVSSRFTFEREELKSSRKKIEQKKIKLHLHRIVEAARNVAAGWSRENDVASVHPAAVAQIYIWPSHSESLYIGLSNYLELRAKKKKCMRFSFDKLFPLVTTSQSVNLRCSLSAKEVWYLISSWENDRLNH